MFDPLALGANCAACPLAKDGRPHKPVPATVPAGEIVGVLVGEGPGHDEVAARRPFVGMTGQKLDEELEAVGLDRRKLLIVNATACYPTEKKGLRAAVKCCAPVFQHFIEKTPPATPVFAMGAHAVSALNIKAKVANGRGFVRVNAWREQATVIISWHPTFAFFRSPYNHGAFSIDLERFARLTKGLVDLTIPPVNTAPTAEDVYALVEEADWVVGADIETGPANQSEPWSGLDPLRARLKTVSIASSKRAVATLWGRDSATDRAFKNVLRNPRLLSIWANMEWFDRPVLARYGVQVARRADIRDLRRALSATSRLSVLYIASLYTDFFPWKMNDDGEKMATSRDVEALLRYNGWDSVVQCRAGIKMLKEKEDADACP
jgi:uracil-DNA glycosylase family 4